MASSKEYYEQVLAPVYAWMYGGFSAAVARNVDFFDEHNLSPTGSRLAVDLGAGCGFQSIPLARLGYKVTSLDLDRGLLNELRRNSQGLSIEAIEEDLLRFTTHVAMQVEFVVCMTDTILHLESTEDVQSLISDVFQTLESGGKFVITFRDLTQDLTGLDRFIPVRSDSDTVFTCFLEYESVTVKVHDLVYRRMGDRWELRKSFYRKLRLSPEWVLGELASVGFRPVESDTHGGLVTIIAAKP